MPPPKNPVKYEEWRRKQSESQKRVKGTPEWRKKQSEAQKKRWDNQEARKRNSERQKKVKGTPEARKKNSERVKKYFENPEARKKHSEVLKKVKGTPEARNKTSDALKKYNAENPEARKKNTERLTKYHKEHPEARKKHSEFMCGEKSPSWKGGISFLPYCFAFNPRRKRATRNFFDNHCIVCGKHVSENFVGKRQIALSIHHIDHDKEQGCSGKPFNLVPLCHSCHAKENHNEEEYRVYINRVLDEGFKWGIWSREEYERKVMYAEVEPASLSQSIVEAPQRAYSKG